MLPHRFNKLRGLPQLGCAGTPDGAMATRSTHLVAVALPCSSTTGMENDKVNPHQQFNPQCGQLSAAQIRPNDQRPHPSLNLTVESFDIWWQRINAHHAVMAAQASALMRAHRRASASSEFRANQAH